MHDANAANAGAIGLSGPATDGRSVLPVVDFRADYAFEGPEGTASLLEGCE